MRVLVATDGNPAARRALDIVNAFPWPRGTRVRGVVALGRPVRAAGAAAVRSLHARAEDVRRALKARWPSAQVVELHDTPAQAVVEEARRFRADVIVLGCRGRGLFARLVAGSVSRTVAERAPCPVLVVRGAPGGSLRRFAVGFDASGNARLAVRFLARLDPPAAAAVSLVSVVQRLSPQRSLLAAQQAAARALRARGWNAVAAVREGAPVDELLSAARASGAQLIVVGAAARSGLERLVLGSVAAGVLERARVPVLLVRRRLTAA